MEAGIMEIWKPIEGFPHYQVSNLGRVKSTWHRHISHDLILKTVQETIPSILQ